MGRTFSGRIDSKVFLEEDDLEENSACGTVSGMVKHQSSLSSVDSIYDDLGFESRSPGKSSRQHKKEDVSQSREDRSETKPALFRRTPQLRQRSQRSDHVPEAIENQIENDTVKQVRGSQDSNGSEGALSVSRRSFVRQSDESPTSVSLTQSTQGKNSRVEEGHSQQSRAHQPPETRRSKTEQVLPVQKRVALLKEVSKSVFGELDSNQQGDVSEEEFVEVLFQKPQLLRTLNAPLPRSESEREKVYRRLFNSMNRSQSGYLTYEEVESYVSDQQQQQQQQQQQPQLQLGQGQGQGQGQVKMQEQGQRQQQQQQSQSGRGRERGREQNQTMSVSRRQPDPQVPPNSSPQRNRSRGRYDEQSQEAEVEVEAELHELEQELEFKQRGLQGHRGQGQGRGQGRGRQNDRGSSRTSPDKFLQLGRIPSGELDENVFVEDDSNSESDESPSRPRAESRGSRETSLQMRSSEPPVPSYADMFKLIDRNSDGKLSLMEFMQALRRHPTLAEVSFFVSPFLAWAILLFCSSLPCFVLILS
jgi:Ca2+-binding EF-hand superfamily protein